MRQDSELSVNLSYLENNFRKLKELAPNNQIIFMVKGNAYGHGIVETSSFAADKIKIKNFGVACLGEALTLNQNIPNINIYVFSELNFKDKISSYFSNSFIPVISNMRDLESFITHEKFNNHKFALKFNTGMNRLGFNLSELNEVIDLLQKSNIKDIFHVMTHFAKSYFKIREGDKTNKQYEEFKKIKGVLKTHFNLLETSVSNSGAIEQEFGLDETHIRPGLMLYGPRSVNWSGQIVSSLKTKVLTKRLVKKGEPIGYGGHVCHKEGVLLTIPLGYADGLLTFYSGVKFKIQNFDAKIIARINMDICFIFIDSKDLSLVDVGDELYLWDESQESVSDFCTQANSIPYQLFTSISSRVERKFYYK